MKKFMRVSIGMAPAIAIAESKAWEGWSLDERALFQLQIRELCMPFDVFHQSVEHLLGRGVWTHEFIDMEGLLTEYYDNLEKPTMAEIMDKWPNKEQIVAVEV